MKALKIVGIVLLGVVLLMGLLVGVALIPAVQTWAVRKAVAGQPGLKLEVGRVAAGFSTTELRDLRFEQDGLVVTVPRILVAYSVLDYISHKRIDVGQIEVQGLMVDARKMTAAAPATKAPVEGPAKAPAFVGVLHLAQLPLDVRLGNLAINGRALLPGDRSVDFALTGGGIEIGKRGQLAWKIDFSDPTQGAPLRALHANGSLGVHIAADRRVDSVEVENLATTEGPKLPAESVQLKLTAEQAAPNADEIYTAGLSLVQNGNTSQILNSRVVYLAGEQRLDGTWNVAVHGEQLAALLAGLGLPEVSADGAGKFSFQTNTAAAVASGELNALVTGLERINPQIPAIGPLQLHAAFDGAFADNIVRLNRLELKLGLVGGRKLIQVATSQPVSFNTETRRVAIAKPDAELARIALQGIPLALAQSAAKPFVIDGGKLSGTFSIVAEADGSQVHLRTIRPLSLAGVTLTEGGKKLIDRLNLTLSPSVDYSAARVTAAVPDLNLSLAAGDAATGDFKVDVLNPQAAPVVAFSAKFQERLISVLKPYLPMDPGPISVDSEVSGQLQGQKLRLDRFSSTVKLQHGVLLASVETLQALTADLGAVRVAAANPSAAVARFHLGTLPLTLAERFVPKAKFAGNLKGATFEISLPSADQVAMQTTAPVSLTGIGVAMDGQSLVKGLDLTVDFAATKRGETMSADVRRLEVRQGSASLVRLTAAGGATLGAKLEAKGAGKLDVDLAAVMKQPAFATAAQLARGHLAIDFNLASGDPLRATAKIALRNLVSRQGNQALGDLDCQIDAGLKPDFSSGTAKIPLTLTVGGRRSDLTLDGAFSRTASLLSVTGKLTSSQIIADDFMALAALAPQNSGSASPGTGEQPQAASQASIQGGGSQATSPSPLTATPGQLAASPATPAQTREAGPFWKGFGGRFSADLKMVKYGPDYTVSGIHCAATLDPTRMELASLEGKFKGNAFKVTAGINFAAKDPKPYALKGAVNIPGFDVGAFLRAANPNQPPALETKLTIDAKFDGRGATLPDLAQNVSGQFDVTGSKGVLRALSNKGRKVAGIASVGLGLLGAAMHSDTSAAMGELVASLNEMPFDSFTMHVNRGADLNLKLTSLEFISPDTRLTGGGVIEYKKGVSIANQPLHVEMQLAGKDQMALLLSKLYLLGDQQDDKGYSMMSSPFIISGTPANPDSSQLWKIVGSASVKAAAGMLFR